MQRLVLVLVLDWSVIVLHAETALGTSARLECLSAPSGFCSWYYCRHESSLSLLQELLLHHRWWQGHALIDSDVRAGASV